MQRRDLLKASCLAAVANLGAVAEAADELSVPGTAEYQALLARLPDPAATPDGRYDATIARRLDEDILSNSELLAGAQAHASVISARATLTMGLGDVSQSATVDALERRGFERSDVIDGRPLYVRRSRYRQEVAVAGDGTVIVGRGSRLEPVTSLARTVAVPRKESLAERLPAVASVRDRLGPGAVLSVSPAGRRTPDGTPTPLATGHRLSLPSPDARLRTVAVFESAPAGRSATDRFSTDESTVTRDGRAVVRDATVPGRDLPIE